MAKFGLENNFISVMDLKYQTQAKQMEDKINIQMPIFWDIVCLLEKVYNHLIVSFL